MRRTTNFKRFERGGAVHSDTTIDIQVPQENLERPKPEADDASRAFQLQIDALRQSEEIQRQRAAQAAQAQPALTLKEAAFLKAHPDFLNDHDLAHQALVRAHQGGHIADSDEFHKAVGEHFRALKPPAVETPERPLKAKRAYDYEADDDGPSERSVMVSAPVSREVPSSHYPERPGRITLTPEMKDMARRLGQSEVEYARGLIEMRERDKEFGR
jgi:hypothetical protein